MQIGLVSCWCVCYLSCREVTFLILMGMLVDGIHQLGLKKTVSLLISTHINLGIETMDIL